MRVIAPFLALALCACAPVDTDLAEPAASEAEELRVCRTPPERAARVALERASEGLFYLSESDHPFDYVSYLNAPAGRTITTSQFLRVLGVPASTPIEVRPLDRVLSRLPTLERTVRQRLTFVQVFAVGTIQVHLYIVGRDRCGALVGLHTLSIET
jgi:hypothetical protein